MASKAIRGITVEIGGNTTKLDKALGESQKASRSLQVELKEIEKLLKFDPTNTELLTQKQAALGEMIETTSKKLDTLKEAEAQVIAQFERGEIAENQLRAFQREIVQTESELSGLKSELSSTDTALKNLSDGTDTAEKHTDEYRESVEKAKEELADFKEKAEGAFDAIKTGATVLGGAAVAAGGYALKLTTDFDKAFNTLATKTGASSFELKGLEGIMEDIYSNNFGESIEDVANSMATVKTQTGLAGTQLQNATENALLMRDTFDMEVNESIRAVNSLMNQFGITSDEAYNLIAQGAQKGLNQNDDLLDTINEYSVQFKNAGYSAEDMFNMLANGVDTGTWSVDKLGDAVKEFNIRASDGTVSEAIKENAKAFGLTTSEAKELASEVANGNVGAYQKLADKLKEVDDDTARYQLGVQMFGTMWEDLGEETVLALLNTQGEISKTSSALEDINNTKYDDIGSALQGLGRTLEVDVAKPLGDELKPVVEEVIDYVQANGPQITEVLSGIVSAIGDFVGFIVDNGAAILSVIAGIGAGLLIWNVVSIITGVVNAIKAFKVANEGATVAQWLLNAAMNANPIGILITVIGAIVVAITTFILTNEDARAKFMEIWGNITEFARNAWEGIKTVASTVWNSIKETAVSTWEGIKSGLSTAWSSIKDTAVSVWEGIKTGISTAIEAISTVISTVFESIKTLISAYVTAWWTIIVAIWEAIKTSVSTAINTIRDVISGVFEVIKTVISTYVETWRTIITTAWDLIKTAVSTVVEVVKTTITNVFNGIKTTISSVMSTIQSTISTVWNTIKSTVSSVINGIKTVITSIFNAIKALISGDMNAVKSNMSNAWNAIKSTVSTVVNGIKTVISTVFNGIKTTITTIWNNVKSTTTSVFNGIKSTMSNALNSAKTSVVTACQNIFTGMKNAFANVGSTFKSIGSSVIEGIKNGITGAVSGLYESIKGALGGLVDKAKEALGINSPSRVFAEVVGKQIPAGVAMGVKNNANVADEAVADMAGDLTDQAISINGATINRKLTTTFGGGSVASAAQAVDGGGLMTMLQNISDKLGRLQIVLDTGVLVGETIDPIDAALSDKYSKTARGW